MNTPTVAHFISANQAHASTSRVPLLTPDAIVMPLLKDGTSVPPPDASDTLRLQQDFLHWLKIQCLELGLRRIRPVFVDREVSISESQAILAAPRLPGEWVTLPVGRNVKTERLFLRSFSVRTERQDYANLLFSFVVAVMHYDQRNGGTDVPSSRSVLRQVLLTTEGMFDPMKLREFLASEIKEWMNH